MQDLLVVGLDLETGREVHIGDAPMEHWHARGYLGRRTLVCALCYAGAEAIPGTEVALIARGKVGGLRRWHFAHPPNQAPVGGHHPESLWHLSAKTVLAAWAARQPGVVDVTTERWTPDRTRRSDVRIQFHGGRQVALEAQATPVIDREWLARHDDYRRQCIIDVWLWRQNIPPHWVTLNHAQLLWQLDPAKHRASLLYGAAHKRPSCWWTGDDLHPYAPHIPPCVGDTLLRHEMPLSSLTLTADGLMVPNALEREIHDACAEVRQDAERVRMAASRTAAHRLDTAISHRAVPSQTGRSMVDSGARRLLQSTYQRRTRKPPPLPKAKPGQLACPTCGIRLDPILAPLGRHYGC